MMERVAEFLMTLTLLLLLGPRGSLTTFAATLYVAPTGDDSNPGTESKPFRTIQKAADMAAPGDRVMVRAGIYSESVEIKVSGVPNKPIVFEGERDSKGKWLTIVDRSKPVTKWSPAPEIGPMVYKADDLDFVPYSMTINDKQLARISDNLMSHEKGLEYFKLPPVAMIKKEYLQGEMDFWDGVEVIYGCRGGVTYIRFRKGDDPNKMSIKAAPAGGGFTLKDKSHVVIRRFLIRGAQDGIVIQGAGSKHNVVEENFLMNGHNRVVITNEASQNVVRNNEMTLNYYGYDSPGAWGPAKPNDRSCIRLHIYRVFKVIVGPGSSDDHGVLVREAGDANEVCGNHIYAGLIGVSCGRAPRVNVHHNIIHNMSSIGILTSEDRQKGVHDGEFHDNLVYDCNINLRIHHYNAARDNQRREYHYRNMFYQPEGLGTHVFVHVLPGGWPTDIEHPEIFLYHNTFVGGRTALAPYGEGMLRTRLLNNIFSSAMFCYAKEEFIKGEGKFELCDYNWIGGAYHHGVPAWFGKHNVNAEGKTLWPMHKMPDFRLAANSPARGKGIDLSRPFTLGGKSYGPLPGMRPGYFRGSAPDCGALQYGESGFPPRVLE